VIGFLKNEVYRIEQGDHLRLPALFASDAALALHLGFAMPNRVCDVESGLRWFSVGCDAGRCECALRAWVAFGSRPGVVCERCGARVALGVCNANRVALVFGGLRWFSVGCVGFRWVAMLRCGGAASARFALGSPSAPGGGLIDTRGIRVKKLIPFAAGV
jgi:hypothetical protein